MRKFSITVNGQAYDCLLYTSPEVTTWTLAKMYLR